jgi:hypothetical protein
MAGKDETNAPSCQRQWEERGRRDPRAGSENTTSLLSEIGANARFGVLAPSPPPDAPCKPGTAWAATGPSPAGSGPDRCRIQRTACARTGSSPPVAAKRPSCSNRSLTTASWPRSGCPISSSRDPYHCPRGRRQAYSTLRIRFGLRLPSTRATPSMAECTCRPCGVAQGSGWHLPGRRYVVSADAQLMSAAHSQARRR